MPTIEEFGQQEREIAQKERESNEPQGPSLTDMLAHPSENILFSKYLDHGTNEDKGLGAKLLMGKLDKVDFDALSEKRKEFLEIKDRAKNVRERLEKSMDGIIQSSGELRKLSEVAGPEAIRKAIIDRMDEMAITDPDRFADLEGRFDGLTEVEGKIALGNESIAAICKQYGFKEEEYAKALKAREAGDPYALADLIKSKMSGLKKTFTSSESLLRQEEDIDSRESIKNRLSVVNWSLGNIGDTMATALFENKEAKEILIANLRGEKAQAKDTSFSEIAGVTKKERDPKLIDDAWEEYQKNHEGDQYFDLDSARTQFAEEYAERMVSRKRKGFWASIFRKILSSGIQQRIR